MAALMLAPAGALAVRSTGVAAQAERQTGRPTQVFFSRHPESDDDFVAVFPIQRTAPDAGVARAALRALIDGPTPAEANAGYFSEVSRMLVGPSSCGEDGLTV